MIAQLERRKLEYLYMDYGTSMTLRGSGGIVTPVDLSTHVTDNVCARRRELSLPLSEKLSAKNEGPLLGAALLV